MNGPLPTINEIAKKLPTRTRTRGGGLAFTFDASTSPITGDVVTQFIESASDTVYGKTGPLTDEDLIASAREAIALYTAMTIELGFFPEQVATNRSPYQELKDLFDAELKSLLEGIGASGLSGKDTGGAGGALSPSFDFPPTSIGDGILP